MGFYIGLKNEIANVKFNIFDNKTIIPNSFITSASHSFGAWIESEGNIYGRPIDTYALSYVKNNSSGFIKSKFDCFMTNETFGDHSRIFDKKTDPDCHGTILFESVRLERGFKDDFRKLPVEVNIIKKMLNNGNQVELSAKLYFTESGSTPYTYDEKILCGTRINLFIINLTPLIN